MTSPAPDDERPTGADPVAASRAGPVAASRRGPVAAREAAERVFREEQGAALAALIRHLGGFQLAEDAVQDAFAAAVTVWPRDGLPDRPAAWIMTTARGKAIERLRREQASADRVPRLDARERRPDNGPEPEAAEDDRLRLIFTCCHPALALSARVALVLSTLGGLTTAEIARAFVVSEPTMAQRLVRAKRKIADAGIPYRIPEQAELPERITGVLAVVQLIFDEGHGGSGGETPVRGELCAAAIRLGRLLVDLLPGDPEAGGLLALMLLHDARRADGIDAAGGYVPPDPQDRTRWDGHEIAEGFAALETASLLRRPGPYQLQAAIAALHVEAPDAETTDWERITELYEALGRLAPSPVTEVNRALAVAWTRGPQAGLALLSPLIDDPRLARYQPLYAAQAELLRRAGDTRSAARAYRRAVTLSGNPADRAELERRLAQLPE